MKPAVRLECENCPWRYDVPDDDIYLDDGLPAARTIPTHTCPDGHRGTLRERAFYDAELVTIAPAHNFVLKLE